VIRSWKDSAGAVCGVAGLLMLVSVIVIPLTGHTASGLLPKDEKDVGQC
jgi:hypothetical protein